MTGDAEESVLEKEDGVADQQTGHNSGTPPGGAMGAGPGVAIVPFDGAPTAFVLL